MKALFDHTDHPTLYNRKGPPTGKQWESSGKHNIPIPIQAQAVIRYRMVKIHMKLFEVDCLQDFHEVIHCFHSRLFRLRSPKHSLDRFHYFHKYRTGGFWCHLLPPNLDSLVNSAIARQFAENRTRSAVNRPKAYASWPRPGGHSGVQQSRQGALYGLRSARPSSASSYAPESLEDGSANIASKRSHNGGARRMGLPSLVRANSVAERTRELLCKRIL
ncbi:hypothetical protein QBC35DRAFT_151339 [Podospora australis]|uniref:Uncharacterized protein n=1 Tax=Podospora australis TaxID=1536484 RepID=A0AAN6WLL4_9PEZI|nr:hypothetical protein QBC35DRAFT_151339 [Podospora australis]